MAPSRQLCCLLLAAGTAAQSVGNVACWGTTPQSTVPADLGPVLELAVGFLITCVRTAAEPGRPRCWGDGNAITADAVAVPADLVDVDRLWAGGFHACARRPGGNVSCWGSVKAELPPVEQLSLSWTHTVALLPGGIVQCWGNADDAQNIVPTDLGTGVRSVAAGTDHTCAVPQDGSVRCWGDNKFGQIPPAGLTGVVHVLAGAYTTCALKDDSSIQCWGRFAGLPDTAFDRLIVNDQSLCTMSSSPRGWRILDCWGHSINSNGRNGLLQTEEVVAAGLGHRHACALLPTTTTTTSTTTGTATTVTDTTVTTRTTATPTTTQSSSTETSTSSSSSTWSSSRSSSSSTMSSTWSSTSSASSTVSSSTSSSTSSTATGSLSTTTSMTTDTTATRVTETTVTMTRTTTTPTQSSSTETSTTSASSTWSSSTSSSSSSSQSTSSSTAETMGSTSSTSSTGSLSSSTSGTTSRSSSSMMPSSSPSASLVTSSMWGLTSLWRSTLLMNEVWSTLLTTTMSSSSSSGDDGTSSTPGSSTAEETTMAARAAATSTATTPNFQETTMAAMTTSTSPAATEQDFEESTRMATSTTTSATLPSPKETTMAAIATATSTATTQDLEATTTVATATSTTTSATLPSPKETTMAAMATATSTATTQDLEATTMAAKFTSTATVATSPSPKEAANALFGAVEETTKSILESLSDSNEATLVEELVGGGAVAVSKLSQKLADLQKEAGSGEGEEVPSISVEAPGTGVEASLPTTMFAALKANGVEEDMALVVSSFDPSSANVKGLGKSGTDESGEKIEVASAAVIELRGLRSKDRLTLEGLADPITFWLPSNFSLGMTCAYWDEKENAWSSRGTWASTSNNVGDRIECKTVHLSLFGAIVRSIIKTLACVNVLNLFNEEAMQEVLEGSWVRSLGAVMLGAVYLMLAISFALAAFLDHVRGKRHHWQDSFLLVYKPSQSAIAVSRQGASEACMGSLCACCFWLQESDVVRQALDDIASNWFSQFGEVRSAVETCCAWSAPALAALGSWAAASQLTHKVAAQLMILVSRRDTAAHLALDTEVVSFVLDDKDLRTFLLTELSHAAGADWRRKQNQAEAWAGLREEVCNHMVRHIKRQGRRRPKEFLRTVGMLILTENPLGALFVHNIFSSCKLRVFTFSAEVLGALAVSCLFFERTGMAKGKPRGGPGQGSLGCSEDGESDGDMDLGEGIGRVFVVALGCLLVAGIPVHILTSLQTKSFKVMSDPPGSQAWVRQLRAWRFQERLVIVLGSLYNSACSFYIITFIANMGKSDHSEWSTTGALALCQDLLLLPFAMAMSMPLMAQAILALHLRVSTASTDRFTRQVCELLHECSNAMLPIERI